MARAWIGPISVQVSRRERRYRLCRIHVYESVAVGALSDAHGARYIAPGIVTCIDQALSLSLPLPEREANVSTDICRSVVSSQRDEIYMNHTRRSYLYRFLVRYLRYVSDERQTTFREISPRKNYSRNLYAFS